MKFPHHLIRIKIRVGYGNNLQIEFSIPVWCFCMAIWDK